MSRFTLATVLATLAAGGVVSASAAPPYSAVQVDPFAAANGVALPADYQAALVESIARELSVEFSTVLILREADTAPDGRAVLRISGTVTQFKPAGSAKRLLSFGSGAASLTAEVRFGDAAAPHVLAIREFQGDVQGIGRKIAKFCKSERLVDSN